MGEFKIEKGVPMPQPRRVGRPSRYPFLEMKRGDSFFVAAPKGGEKGLRIQVSTALQKMRGRHWPDDSKVFSYRTVEGGVRVWRTK